jgi:hypothetical protein
MQTPWESELAELLTELSAAQDQTLEILARKRELLVAGDEEGLAALAKQEETAIQDLQQCLRRREQLLERASTEGLPGDSIQSLAKALPSDAETGISERVGQATLRTRLLKHHSLTNWVLVQRTLLHLSQMLEIIATRGKLQPTYGKEEATHLCGALVDRAA